MAEIYVQVLLVLQPQGKLREQNQFSDGKILLCNWTSGAFAGRFTGLIKLVDVAVSNDAKSDLLKIAKDIIPSELQTKVREIDLVGILKFDGPPESDEYIYLATINDNTMTITKGIKFNANPCVWFDCNKIPYENMPADDAIWYPKVLHEREKVCGSFEFGGWSERTIKSYDLRTVKDL